MKTAIGEISEKLRRSTVLVESGGRGWGSGSGVIWSSDGTIVTNAHVARSNKLLIHLWDGRVVEAETGKRHPRRDLALLRIPAKELPAAEFADSSALRPGQIVIAVGNPLGFQGAASSGVVHALGPLRGLGRQTWIQADVRLAPGNSGGPLADAGGRVIGINTMIAGGIGLAIPSNTVADFVRRPEPPRLGVSVQWVRVPEGGLGLLLLEVEAGSAAHKASLMPGDLLVGIGGQPLRDAEDLSSAIESGGRVKLQFLRGDRTQRREVVVRPEAT